MSTYIIVSCDKDITPLINKIKSQGKKVILVTFAINIDWDVMKNYGDQHYWFEESIGIDYKEPEEKATITVDLFKIELENMIKNKGTDINYALFSQGLQKRFICNRSDVDNCRDTLLTDGIIEIYSYEFNGRTYQDGIKIIISEE